MELFRQKTVLPLLSRSCPNRESLKFFSESSKSYVLVSYVSSQSLVLKEGSGVLLHSSTFLLCSHQSRITLQFYGFTARSYSKLASFLLNSVHGIQASNQFYILQCSNSITNHHGLELYPRVRKRSKDHAVSVWQHQIAQISVSF